MASVTRIFDRILILLNIIQCWNSSILDGPAHTYLFSFYSIRRRRRRRHRLSPSVNQLKACCHYPFDSWMKFQFSNEVINRPVFIDTTLHNVNVWCLTWILHLRKLTPSMFCVYKLLLSHRFRWQFNQYVLVIRWISCYIPSGRGSYITSALRMNVRNGPDSNTSHRAGLANFVA